MKERYFTDIREFLRDYPRMAIQPSKNSSIVLKGIFDFSAQMEGENEIIDSYKLEIGVPFSFPNNIPQVTELGQKIPRRGEYHVNPAPDNTLCLGSPIRLLLLIIKEPTLVGFVKNCLIPYLYAVSKKLREGGELVFGGLRHGTPGVLDDYKKLFGFKSNWQVIQILKLLSNERRFANKLACPCGCRRKLKNCRFHKTLNSYRKIASITWFKNHAESLGINTNCISEFRKLEFKKR